MKTLEFLNTQVGYFYKLEKNDGLKVYRYDNCDGFVHEVSISAHLTFLAYVKWVLDHGDENIENVLLYSAMI